MIFTEEEQKKITTLTNGNPLLEKLWKEYLDYHEDASKILFASYNKALKEIARMIEEKEIKEKNIWLETVLEIGKNGDKLFNTLQRGKTENPATTKTETIRDKKHKDRVLI